MPSMRSTTAGAIVLALGVTAAESKQRTVQSENHPIRVETVATGLEHPWGLALLPDGRFLVTERNSGQLRIGTADGTLSRPLDGVPDVFRYPGPTDRSQGGLFHVALHPDFEANRLIYVSFSQPSEEGTGTAVARGRLAEEGERARLDDVEVVYTMNKHDSSGLHFGGRFAFHPETKNLYVSVGERRNISRSQDREDHAGSIVRVTDEGQVPQDNPFVDDPKTDDKIFALGMRNPQGMAFHPDSQELWASDHGPKGGDEINRVLAGRNYGWPFQTAGTDYSGAPLGQGTNVEGMESPVHVFEKTVAPSGVAFYTGGLFQDWRGDLLVGGLRSEALERLKIENGKIVELESISLGRRIRDVQVAWDGTIWLITEHEHGEVLRLVPGDQPEAVGTGSSRR
jgi:aldose sugar dehydrogenase